MGKFIGKLVSAFTKKPTFGRGCQKAVKLKNGDLTYLFNPKTNHTVLRDTNRRMSIVMNGRYPQSNFLRFGFNCPNGVSGLGDSKVIKIVNAKDKTICTRKPGHDFWPTLTNANSEFRYLG